MKKSCNFTDCGRVSVGNTELCKPHYEQKRRGRTLTPIRKRRKTPEKCMFDTCDRFATGHGLCDAHRWQKKNKGTLSPVRPRAEYRGSRKRDDSGNKKCPRCSEWQPETNYSTDPSKSDGLSPWCKPCSAKYKIEWRYGLTKNGFDRLLDSQNNKCAICGVAFGGKVRPCIDHDHNCCPGKGSCGKCVRGILCYRCNTVAGFLTQNDDAARFFAYINASRTMKRA